MKRNIKDKYTWIGTLVVIVFVLFAGCAFGQFADQRVAENTLVTNGFTNVKLIDRDSVFVGFKGCGKGDTALFTFTAINPIGKNVTVKVCQGWPLKGATIRGTQVLPSLYFSGG